jgi:hypothetical protein
MLTKSGPFNEEKIECLSRDIRLTLKDDVIYAVCLGEIGGEVIINSPEYRRSARETAGISLLGDGGDLPWKQGGRKIILVGSRVKRRKDANVFRIRRNGAAR